MPTAPYPNLSDSLPSPFTSDLAAALHTDLSSLQHIFMQDQGLLGLGGFQAGLVQPAVPTSTASDAGEPFSCLQESPQQLQGALPPMLQPALPTYTAGGVGAPLSCLHDSLQQLQAFLPPMLQPALDLPASPAGGASAPLSDLRANLQHQQQLLSPRALNGLASCMAAAGGELADSLVPNLSPEYLQLHKVRGWCW